MRIGSRVGIISRHAAAIVIGCAMSLLCARAQTAEVTLLPSNVTMLMEQHGPDPNILIGNIKLVVHHVTTCDKFIFQTETHHTSSKFSGCIRGADQSAGPVQIKIAGVHTGRIADTGANQSGEFLFRNVSAGDYVLFATQGAKALTLTTIQLPLKISPLVVDVRPLIGDTLYVGEY
jgi:hypothetical protein